MEQIIKDFGIDPVLLAAQIVNFLILLYILKKFAYKPILNGLEKRKQMIAQSLKNAEEIELKLQKTEEERESVLEKAAKEARIVLDEAAKSAEGIIHEARLKAQSDMEEMLEKGKESIQLERVQMQQEIKTELADIVAISLEKIIKKSVSEKEQKKLIEDTLKSM